MARPTQAANPIFVVEPSRKIPLPPDISNFGGIVVGAFCVVGGVIVTCPISVPIIVCSVVAGAVICAAVATEFGKTARDCYNEAAVRNAVADAILTHWIKWREAHPDWETSGETYTDANEIKWLIDKFSDREANNRWAEAILESDAKLAACLKGLSPGPSTSNPGGSPSNKPRM